MAPRRPPFLLTRYLSYSGPRHEEHRYYRCPAYLRSRPFTVKGRGNEELRHRIRHSQEGVLEGSVPAAKRIFDRCFLHPAIERPLPLDHRTDEAPAMGRGLRRGCAKPAVTEEINKLIDGAKALLEAQGITTGYATRRGREAAGKRGRRRTNPGPFLRRIHPHVATDRRVRECAAKRGFIVRVARRVQRGSASSRLDRSRPSGQRTQMDPRMRRRRRLGARNCRVPSAARNAAIRRSALYWALPQSRPLAPSGRADRSSCTWCAQVSAKPSHCRARYSVPVTASISGPDA